MMRATILSQRVLEHAQSASALERVDDYYFVIGDDASSLFRLDANFNLVGTTRLFPAAVSTLERIAKQAKPDLEALCSVEWNGAREMLCMGSGSRSPARDVCYRVDVTNPALPQTVRAVPLTGLYNTLRANPGIVGARQLNIEAAAATSNSVLLFQRGNISGINAVMEFDLRAFMQFLDAPNFPPPTPRVTSYALPAIKNCRAGFSAALVWNHSILFAATVEDTDNEIDDGATLGSFIGQIADDEIKWITAVEHFDPSAPVKIEGIAVREWDANGLNLMGVTDSDDGASEILQIQIT